MDGEEGTWDDEEEEDGRRPAIKTIDDAIERAQYYRTAPPYGLTDDELVWAVLDEAGDLVEAELRRALFDNGLIDSPETPVEIASRKGSELRKDMPELADDTLVEMILKDVPGADEGDLRRILVGWGVVREPEVHGPYTPSELVRLAAAQGRSWRVVAQRLRFGAPPEELRALQADFNRTAGLRGILGAQYGAYWCGKCERVHFLRATIGRRHAPYEARHHVLEPI